MKRLLQRWWENAGCRGGPCVCPFLFGHVMIAPEGAPTGMVEDTRCRSGFSRDLFMGSDNGPLTEGPLPLAGARGICGLICSKPIALVPHPVVFKKIQDTEQNTSPA
jgi:hypothetical protein